MKNILNPEFNYIPSAKTDIRETFERIRKEQKLQTLPQELNLDKPLVGKSTLSDKGKCFKTLEDFDFLLGPR
jgi:hypothetical protein